MELKEVTFILNSFNVLGAFNSRSKKPKQEENKCIVNCHNMFDCLQEEGNDFSSSLHKDFEHLQKEGNGCFSCSHEVVQVKDTRFENQIKNIKQTIKTKTWY